MVGEEMVRAVMYADDISPINPSPEETNAALHAISKAGTFNAYKFKPSKCKIIGPEWDFATEYILGGKVIERAKCGLLLGVVVDGTGVHAVEHVSRRAKKVATSIKLIRSWRTKGLSFSVAYKHLFFAKVVPRFTYAFSLLPLTKWSSVHDLIRKTLERALCCTFGCSVPKGIRVQPGVWFVVCGFTSVFALLRKLKLEMAAGLKVGDNKAGRIFRSLYRSNKGSFERDVHLALKDWLLLGLWDILDTKTLSTFKNKTLKISKKCWPQGLQRDGNLAWLYHNHMVFSGNVPNWADWNWYNKRDKELFKLHFYYLLIGAHPAVGSEACCSRLLCRGSKKGMVYQHHYFEFGDNVRNRMFFQNRARGLYNEMIVDGHYFFPRRVLDDILE